MAQRLTDRQVAVLAAVERLGEPTLPELGAELPDHSASTILRALDALDRRGLIEATGDRTWVYAGDLAIPGVPDHDPVRFRRIAGRAQEETR